MMSLLSNTLFLMVFLDCVFSAPLFGQEVSLADEERDWLEAHPDIHLGYTDTFEPEVIVNPDDMAMMKTDFVAAVDRSAVQARGLTDHIAWRLIQLAGVIVLLALAYRFVSLHFLTKPG